MSPKSIDFIQLAKECNQNMIKKGIFNVNIKIKGIEIFKQFYVAYLKNKK